MTENLYLDIMEDGRFLCQMLYTGPIKVRQLPNGQTTRVIDDKEAEEFIYSKRPSLRNRNIRVLFSKQRV